MMAQGPLRFSTIGKPILKTFEILNIFRFLTFHMAMAKARATAMAMASAMARAMARATARATARDGRSD